MLGEGAYGKVLLVGHKNNKDPSKYLAMKCIRKDITIEEELIDACFLEKECLELSGLDSIYLTRGVCTFHDPTYLYYAMEFNYGGNLYNLKRSQPKKVFNEKQVNIIGLEILFGLKFLHKNNFVYRDLKLDNVLIGPTGHVKIADFGHHFFE